MYIKLFYFTILSKNEFIKKKKKEATSGALKILNNSWKNCSELTHLVCLSNHFIRRDNNLDPKCTFVQIALFILSCDCYYFLV